MREKEEKRFLTCGCCGKGYYGIPPRDEDGCLVYDVGYGMCEDCGGNPRARSFKKRIGWAGRVFFEARFGAVRDALSEKNKKKWDKLNYNQKCYFITKMIEEGLMI